MGAIGSVVGKGMHVLNMVGGPLSALTFYTQSRANGRGVLGSTAIAAAQAVAWTAFQWPMLAFQLAPLVEQGLASRRRAEGAMQKNIIPQSPFGMQNDTPAAATSRARGVAAIMDSRMNARSSLGSEAGLFAARYK